MEFNEDYFIKTGYGGYKNYPHFKQRAEWIKANLKGSILEVGCAHGYLLKELANLGIRAAGVDKSSYAIDMKADNVNIILSDIAKFDTTIQFDWVISWNTLDCLDNEEQAIQVAKVMNSISLNQLHILCMSGQNYINDGYFIRDYSFWRNIYPHAYLICSECGKVYQPNIDAPIFSEIPLVWGKVSK